MDDGTLPELKHSMGMDEFANIVYGYGIGKVEIPLHTFSVPETAKAVAKHVKELSEDALPANDGELGDLFEKLGLPRRKPAGYEEDEDAGEVDEDADEEGVDIGLLEILEVPGITIGKYGQGADVQFSVGFPLIELGLEYFGKVAIGGKDLEEATRVLKDLRPLFEKLFHIDLQDQEPALYVSVGME